MKKLITCLLLVLVAAPLALAQGGSNDIKENDFNPVNTGVTTLGIAPDARSTGMGYLGAATDPDVNSQYWNPSKYAFGYSQGGMALSYTPWLRKIVNDIFLAELAGYWKPGSGDNQAISASFRYFSLGEVTFGGNQTGGGAVQTINPYEMAFDLGYSRKLSEHFSMGVVLRYILSDLSWTDTYTSESNSAASAFSADISGYYVSYPMIGRNECQFAWGFNLSNIGTKVSYDHGANNAFLPTNLRLGANFMFPLADYHTLAFGVDANKLLVPTKPRSKDYDTSTPEGQLEYEEAVQKWNDQSPIAGIFKSFSDAPRRLQGGAAGDYLEPGCRVRLQPAVLRPHGLLLRERQQGRPLLLRLRRGLFAQRSPPRRLLPAGHLAEFAARPDPALHPQLRPRRPP